MMEEDFPRGGKERGDGNPKMDDPELFQTKGKKRSGDSAAGKKVKKLKISGKVDVTITNKKIESLTGKTLCPGMVVLGCVKEIHDFELLVNLPGGQSGIVPITSISEAYTAQLQRLSSNQNGEVPDEDVGSLGDLFKPGSLICCKISDVRTLKSGKMAVKLSIKPSDINGGLSASSLKSGMVLYGCIASCEDHGYVMDLGIKGTQAFLSKIDAEYYIQIHNDDCPLKIGQGVWCRLKLKDTIELTSGESRSVTVSIDPKKVQKCQLKNSMGVAFNSLSPGMKVKATVKRVTDDGITVDFLSFPGSIHKSQLPGKPGKYEKKQEVKACVLYIHPVTKNVSLSLLPCHVDSNGTPLSHLLTSFKVGDIVEEARVSRTDSKGIYLKLAKNCQGYASINNLSDTKQTTIGKEFENGTIHRCRVMSINAMDDLVMVTLKESILEQQFISIRDVKPGMEVQGDVLKINSKGIEVKVSGRISGFIPQLHSADVPLTKLDKKFKAGKRLKCRVWSVDEKKSRLILTHKKSLINPKHPMVTSFDELQIGLVFDGIVVQANRNGILVVTYNNVKGWVPVSDLSEERVEYPEKAFRLGQMVQCRVKSTDEGNRKVLLSLKLGDTLGKKVQSIPPAEDFEVGKIITCKVSRKTGTGFDVRLLPSGRTGFLPKMHLSDWPMICDLLYELYQPGDEFQVMYFALTNVTVVTKKPMFLAAARAGQIVTQFDDLQPGQILPGVIKFFKEYGMFVELGGGLVGLAPNKYTVDKLTCPLSEIFKPGQSVHCKITETSVEKSRFLVSTRLSDCYHGDAQVGVDLLKQYLSEMQLVSKVTNSAEGPKSKLSGIGVGSLVQVTVTDVTEHGVLCELDSGVKGLITIDHLNGQEMRTGDVAETVVLHVDWTANCIQLSLCSWLKKNIHKLKDKKSTQVKEGQAIKSEVTLVKDDFILVLLKSHAAGRLAYLPRRQHLNDVQNSTKLTMGQSFKTVIKGTHDGVIVGQMFQDSQRGPLEAKRAVDLKDSHLQPGAITEARILKVYPQQLNIDLNGVHGRVHITEIVDNIKKGQNPLAKYKRNQKIKVKILGYREMKTYKFLPISHPNFIKAIPECTLKPSKLASDSNETEEMLNSKEFKVGDEVTGFVQQHTKKDIFLHLSTTQRGILSLLDTTDKIQVLQRANKLYRDGQAVRVTVSGVQENGLLQLNKTDYKPEVKVGSVLPAIVVAETPAGVRLQLADGYQGRAKMSEKKLQKGQLVKCRILKVQQDTRQCTVLLKKTRSLKNKMESEIPASLTQSDSGVEVESDGDKQGAVKEESRPCLTLSTGFSWNEDFNVPVTSAADWSSEESDEEEKVPRKRLRKDTKAKEKQIQKVEGQTNDPQTAEDFDRQVLRSPNSSVVWLRYITFYLESAEVDMARAVAERALKTIAFGEEQERINIWVTLLNLENTFGTSESLKEVLTRASEKSDPYKIHQHLVTIFKDSNKLQEAEQLLNVMQKKFSAEKGVWEELGQLHYETGRSDAAHKLLQRAVAKLNKRSQADVIAKFAELEFQHGSPEVGRTMFTNLINTYPGRKDLHLRLDKFENKTSVSEPS